MIKYSLPLFVSLLLGGCHDTKNDKKVIEEINELKASLITCNEELSLARKNIEQDKGIIKEHEETISNLNNSVKELKTQQTDHPDTKKK